MQEKLEVIVNEMEEMQKSEDSRDWDRWRTLKSMLDEAYKSKDEYWNRKSRVRWLQEGGKTQNSFMLLLQKEERGIELKC